MQQINSKKWSGIDVNGNFLQTYIHDHGDGVQVLVGTAKQHVLQMGFSGFEDINDFLKNKKCKR